VPQSAKKDGCSLMVTAIPGLSTEDKRELLHLLNPVRSSGELTGEELEAEIVRNLRRSLGLSGNIDLAQGFRRRMIELTPEFALAGPFDLRTDASIARELIDAVFEQVADLTELIDDLKSSDEARQEFAEFETYLKTKNSEHRREWLHRAALAETIARSGTPDPVKATQAEESSGSHSATARTLVKALNGATSGGVADRNGPVSVANPAALSTAAAPLGVVAAGTFLHVHRRRRRDTGSHGLSQSRATDDRGERTRSRLSPMVQTIVTVCAFLLARSTEPA